MKTQTAYKVIPFTKKGYLTKSKIELVDTSVEIKPFYLTPNRIEGVSAVNLLTRKIGIEIGGVKTLNTGLICINTISNYNNFELSLFLKDDFINLKVCFENVEHTGIKWGIDNIVVSMKRKNRDTRINKEFVKDLFMRGKLSVKFNVSLIKDHGTLWKISK